MTRFLWLQDPKKLTTENNLQIYRFTQICFGLRSSPFLLAATLNYHLNKDGSEVAKDISKNIYVDNIITSVKTEKDAIDFYKKAKFLFQAASMNLREWASNSKDFMENLMADDRAASEVVSVLGLAWNTKVDELSIAPFGFSSKIITKRTVLQFIASIYNPLGLFSPAILPAKLFLQKL